MAVVEFPVTAKWQALEFFAGIGLARAGMEAAGISTVWANDYDANKQAMYEQQWGPGDLVVDDVRNLEGMNVPTAQVAWCSSPCTDLSLAGKRVGLRGGKESSAFFGFIDVLRGMGDLRPEVVVVENVTGLASSSGGEDFRVAILELNQLRYTVDALVVDARRFLPQSRPRMFIIGAQNPITGIKKESELRPESVAWIHEDPSLDTFMAPLPSAPAFLSHGFSDLVEPLEDEDPRWWSPERTKSFIDSMSPTQRTRLDRLAAAPVISARTAYRRTRNGKAVWKMRSEDIAGCLRTARGGSSKQAVVLMGQGKVRVRWMLGIEYARLMGAEHFCLDGLRESQVQYGFGDAVAVPVVEWIAQNVIVPVLESHVGQMELQNAI